MVRVPVSQRATVTPVTPRCLANPSWVNLHVHAILFISFPVMALF